MKYAKPIVTLLAPAISAVQSSTIKQRQVVPDSMFVLATNAAYEADE